MLGLQLVKKQYVGAAAAVLLSAGWGIAMALGPLAPLTNDGVGLSSTQRLMAIFEARSPGERTKGELAASKLRLKAKTARQQALARTPSQRALGKVLPPKSETPKAFVEALAPPPATAVAPEFASLVPVGAIMGPPVLPTIGASGIFALPLGGGGGGGGVAPGAPGSVVSVVPAAVPEPSTWAMMLLGFGVIGFAMRRRPGRSTAMVKNS